MRAAMPMQRFDLINDDSTPLRASDHDGLVLFIFTDEIDDDDDDDDDD